MGDSTDRYEVELLRRRMRSSRLAWGLALALLPVVALLGAALADGPATKLHRLDVMDVAVNGAALLGTAGSAWLAVSRRREMDDAGELHDLPGVPGPLRVIGVATLPLWFMALGTSTTYWSIPFALTMLALVAGSQRARRDVDLARNELVRLQQQSDRTRT